MGEIGKTLIKRIRWQHATVAVLIICGVVFAIIFALYGQKHTPNSKATTTGTLVLDDEFNGPAGSQPSSSIWQIMGGSNPEVWGQECFNNSSQHVYEDGNGNLVLAATYNPNGTSCSGSNYGPYESGGITTGYKYGFGTFEASIKVPCYSGNGLWPAWWMDGPNWPTNGEIDTLEVLYGEYNGGGIGYYYAKQSLHGPLTSGGGTWDLSANNPWEGTWPIPPVTPTSCSPYSNAFHTYGVIWSPDQVQFTLDGNVTYTATPANMAAVNGVWPFDTTYFKNGGGMRLLLDLQVGSHIGNPITTGGGPVIKSSLPQDMLVDWVRVYNDTPSPSPTPTESITSPTNGAVVSGNLTVNADASETNGSIAKVTLYIDGSAYATDTASPYNFSVDTSKLSNGTHSLYVVATDGGGNQGTSSTVSISVSNASPTVTLTSPAGGATITGTVPIDASVTNDSLLSYVQLYANGNVIAKLNSAPYNYSWNTTNLTPGSYNLKAEAVNTNGNTYYSGSETVTVQSLIPPVPTNLTAPTVKYDSVSLSWTEPSSGASAVSYIVYRNNVVIATPSTASYTDTTVLPNTTYSYSVAAVGANNLVSAMSASISVTTPTQPDTKPPTTPTNFTATAVSTSQVNLSWTASTDDVAVAGYSIERNGQVIAKTTGTSYGDANLNSGTTYSYQVAAYDVANNYSPYTSAVSVTTPNPGPTNPGQSPGVTVLYYPDSDFSGTAYTFVAPQVVGDFGPNYSPVPNLSPSSYSMTFRGRVVVATAGTYTFVINSSQAKITYWLNNQLVVRDNAPTSNPRTYSISLTPGQYNFRLRYQVFDASAAANVGLSWSGPGISEQLIPEADLYPYEQGLTGEYYNNKTLSGAPIFRLDPTVAFNWGSGSPIEGIGGTDFSVNWKGEIRIDTGGIYTFYTQTDDGDRLWVNNQELINEWHDHSLKQYYGSISLNPGVYPISMQFYQHLGVSAAYLQWSGPGINQQTIPTSNLYESPPIGALTP